MYVPFGTEITMDCEPAVPVLVNWNGPARDPFLRVTLPLIAIDQYAPDGSPASVKVTGLAATNVTLRVKGAPRIAKVTLGVTGL